MDCDLKRGSIGKDLNLSSIDRKEYKLLSVNNIEKLKVKENFYVLPKIKGLRNSFQFLFSSEFEDKVKEIKTYFDYVIIDTAPLLGTSDTISLLNYADLNFLMCCHEVTKANELKQVISSVEQTGSKIDGIIYNLYEKPTGYYGYYGLYGDYAYEYYAKKYLYKEYDYE